MKTLIIIIPLLACCMAESIVFRKKSGSSDESWSILDENELKSSSIDTSKEKSLASSNFIEIEASISSVEKSREENIKHSEESSKETSEDSSKVYEENGFDEEKMKEIIASLRLHSCQSPSLLSGQLASTWKMDETQSPEELGLYLNGDILFPQEDRNIRNFIVGLDFRWPGGVVPYKLSTAFNRRERRQIRDAMQLIEKTTCIRFKYYNGDLDYVSIESDNTGCWSSVGRQGGRQRINLQKYPCFGRTGTIIHELLHTVGMYHEESRFDRNENITINWNNILPGRDINFFKLDSDPFGHDYDHKSIMHCTSKAFSKNSLRTVLPKNFGDQIGQRLGLSKFDVLKIRAMYNC